MAVKENQVEKNTKKSRKLAYPCKKPALYLFLESVGNNIQYVNIIAIVIIFIIILFNFSNNLWRHVVVVITTAQLHSIKPELRFCPDSNPSRSVTEIRDGDDL